MGMFTRLVVLTAALLSSSAMLASSAGAVIWHNTGDTAFTALGGVGTLSSTSTPLICTGTGTATGTVAATPAGVSTWSMASGTITLSMCTVSGQSVGVDCGYTLTATSQSGTVTNGTFDATCGVYLANIKICHISGTDSFAYTNPVAPSTFGKIQLGTGGTLRVSNGASNCPMGNGDLGHLSPLTFIISSATGGPTPHLGPVITRTA